MGIAAAAVLFAAALHFVFSGYHGGTSPQMPVLNVGQMPQVSQPPSKGDAAEASFDASAYGANYTLVFTFSLGGATLTTEGWFVVGVGPSGNYSFGSFTFQPLRDAAVYKSATEGDVAHIVTCFDEHCTADRKRWPFANLIEGIGAARTAVGQCRHLGYTGTLYEERGMLKPKTPRRQAESGLGNYTAYICEVDGVMLYANLTATVSTRGEAVYTAMKIEAVKMGPYRPDVHRLILKEIGTNR